MFQVGGERLRHVTPNRLLAKAWLTADLGAPSPRFHDLRHTFATFALSAGLSVFEVAEMLGDGPSMVFSRYGHAMRDHDEETRRRLDLFAQKLPATSCSRKEEPANEAV